MLNWDDVSQLVLLSAVTSAIALVCVTQHLIWHWRRGRAERVARAKRFVWWRARLPEGEMPPEAENGE